MYIIPVFVIRLDSIVVAYRTFNIEPLDDTAFQMVDTVESSVDAVCKGLV